MFDPVMSLTEPVEEPFEELDFRANDGIEVALLWQREENRLVVSVCDAATGDSFEIDVASDEALDAFQHPYAYAAFSGIEYTVPDRREPVAELVAATDA
jgi:hypothetical protein